MKSGNIVIPVHATTTARILPVTVIGLIEQPTLVDVVKAHHRALP